MLQLLERNAGDTALLEKLSEVLKTAHTKSVETLQNALWGVMSLGLKTAAHGKTRLVIFVDDIDQLAPAYSASAFLQTLQKCVEGHSQTQIVSTSDKTKISGHSHHRHLTISPKPTTNDPREKGLMRHAIDVTVIRVSLTDLDLCYMILSQSRAAASAAAEDMRIC